MNDWLTRDYVKLLGIVHDIGRGGIDSRAINPDKVRLTIEARRDVAKKMIESGVSQRQTAKALGVDQKTISNDVRKNSSKSEEKVRTPKPTSTEEITVEYDVEPDEYREAFLMRTADALAFAVYSGPVDDEVIAAAKRVAEKWKIFTQTLEAKNGQAATKEDGVTA